MKASFRFLTSVFAGFVLVTNTAFPAIGSLINVSARVETGFGENTPAVGFLVPTRKDGAALQVFGQAMGPTLAQYGVQGAMPHPSLSLYKQSEPTVLVSNSDWAIDTNNVRVAAMVGATPFTNGMPDAAFTKMLPGGLFSYVVSPVDGTNGIVLLSLFRGTAGWDGAGGLLNLSGRGITGPGASVLTAGFVIGDNAPLRVLIRGIGPTLAKYGIVNVPSRVSITLFQNYHGTQYALIPDGKGGWSWKLASSLLPGESTNNGWSTDSTNQQAVSAFSANVGAFALPVGSGDSGVVVTLDPGAYTVQVSANDSAKHIALVEVWDASNPLPPIVSGASGPSS